VGLEAAVADPDRVGSILDHATDVTIVFWLLASADGEPEAIAAIHGPRLERLLEKLVDSPVRGFVYEAAGSVRDQHLATGAKAMRHANERWRIPVEIVDELPEHWKAWARAMTAAAERLTTGAA
jgi:hypothetical protein